MKSKEILKFRSMWMGIAILAIVYFHSMFFLTFFKDVQSNIFISILKELKTFFYGGTDIFLFASGIGCWFSLNKLMKESSSQNINATDSYFTFITKRFNRIIPIYLPFCIIWLSYKLVFNDFTFTSAIGNLLSIQEFTGNGKGINWYISAMWLFYILSPYFYSILNKYSKKYQILLLIFTSFLFSIPFIGSKFLITFSRLPVFFIGMVISKYLSENDELSCKNILILFVSFIFGLFLLELVKAKFKSIALQTGLLWYPFIFVVPGGCITLSVIASYFDKFYIFNKINRFFSWLGNYTFEVFLTHLFLFDLYGNLVSKNIVSSDNLMFYIFIIILIIPCSFLLSLISKIIKKVIKI
ncbi:MAG: acyltransferase [Treponema sp.]|nr:acyltransferase [Treponema sp.]